MTEQKPSETAPKPAVLPKVAWLLAVLLPPSAIAGFWRDVVREHLTLAAVLVIVYWAVLTVGKFAAGFVRDLVKRRREGWLDSTDRALARRFSRFGARYAEHTAGALRFIDQKGLSTVGFYAPELDEVFVDVSLFLRAPGQIPGDLLAEAPDGEAGARQSIRDFLGESKPCVLAIVGAPGSGKTTLLRHTARHLSLDRSGKRRPVPMLLYLRDHVAAITADDPPGLAAVLRGTLGRLAADEPAGWFERQLEEGTCTVLLDGLDEVADQDARRRVTDWVERQIHDYPGNDFVITSRPTGYQGASVEGATVVQTRRFTDGQISTFVRGWYLAVERHAAQEDGEEVRHRAESGADDLRDRLRASPGLYQLTVNPLLLTMIANVHRYRGALPGSRSDLYREICQVMLSRRQEAKGLTISPRGSQKELLLRELAVTMMRDRVRDVTRQECERTLTPRLRRIATDLTAEEFLEDVGSNGLLIERENGVLSFAHFTFQEYLAAEYIKDKGPVAVLTRSVDDTWWRECTLLYAAGSDVGRIVSACLRSGTVTALALAFDCAEEGNELDPELREKLNRLLASASDEDLPEDRRRLIEAVAITRQLRQVVPVRGGARLCATPITRDTYAMFVRDMLERGEHRRPDGRPASEYVAGVRGEDAVAFVRWVDGLVGGEARYRLPYREEIEDPTAQSILHHGMRHTPPLCYWTASRDHDSGPELWIPPEEPDPLRLPHELLTTYVARDVDECPSQLAGLLLLRANTAARVALQLLDRRGDLALDLALARLPEVASHISAAFERGVLDDLDRGLLLGMVPDIEARRIPAVVAHVVGTLPEEQIPGLTRLLATQVAGDLQEASALLAGIDVTMDAGGRELAKVWEQASALDHDIRKDRRSNLAANRMGALQESEELTAINSPAFGRLLNSVLANRGRTPASPAALATAAKDGLLEASAEWDVPVWFGELELSGIVETTLSEVGDDPWIREIAQRTGRLMAQEVDREGAVTGETAVQIRLAAMCLAGEFASDGELPARALHHVWAHIAVMMTWLQAREEGVTTPVEAIVLAGD
ncbi:NACHT domain-containing protein [Actinomadura darangshiensis]|uniref:NACHT domain-containing protein n=1 Tax=Actinomadura darangshiensis TaxID=705336 RepID=A0A4R5AQ87_9ACTN|nr:NACHT domain-containing protein [Actinomadura darangshiensis]TDD73816.1 NACHT domain-containing protein [Actinomadura darangshiensis]